MSAMLRSVVRSSAAARSSRRVSRYTCGDSPNERRNSREKWARQARRLGHVLDVERLGVAGVRKVLGTQQVAGGWGVGHRGSIIADSLHGLRIHELGAGSDEA